MAKTPTKRPRVRQRATVADSVQSRPLRKPDRRQAALPLEPMPPWREPCLALLRDRVPSGPDWAFEIKWDGYRVSVRIEGGKARVLTRRGHDWTARFPAIVRAAEERFVNRSLILDGEAVVLDEQGRSDFGLLQKALGATTRNPGSATADEAILYAFDLLYLDGEDLRERPLDDRRMALEDLVARQGVIRLSQEVEEDGALLLRHACAMGLEGVIAKRRGAPYVSGRHGEWLKIKCVQSESFAIVGYEPSTKVRGALASVLLGARQGGGLVYVGHTGTGFSNDAAVALKRRLDTLATDKPAVALKGKGYVWTRPALVAEVEFRGWTSDGKLRHASFKGLREKADNAVVFDMADRST